MSKPVTYFCSQLNKVVKELRLQTPLKVLPHLVAGFLDATADYFHPYTRTKQKDFIELPRSSPAFVQLLLPAASSDISEAAF